MAPTLQPATTHERGGDDIDGSSPHVLLRVRFAATCMCVKTIALAPNHMMMWVESKICDHDHEQNNEYTQITWMISSTV